MLLEEESNPYLLLRESKIARNKGRLAELGLVNSTRDSTGKRVRRQGVNATGPTQGHSSASVVEGRTKHVSVLAPSPPNVVTGTRRSSRLRMRSGASGEISTRNDGSLTAAPSGSDGMNDNSVIQDAELQSNTKATTRKRMREPPRLSLQQKRQLVEPGFTRSTTIDVHKILFGCPYSPQDKANSHELQYHRGMLGRSFETTGKSIVVDTSARLSSFSNSTMLRFNKYSGICEWKGDVIFLWVNIGAPGSEVVNEFLNGGKQITWFGGSKMHQYTPAIQNLIRVGKKVVSNCQESKSAVAVVPDENVGCSIILWCRMYDPTKRTFLPYTCLGRVGYRSHNPDVHPIQFIWDLLDHEELMAVEVEDVVNDSGVKNEFQKIMFQANK